MLKKRFKPKNRKKKDYSRSPNLETVTMIEEFVKRNSGKFNRRKLWVNLPRKVMWQTYLVVLEYLVKIGRIDFDILERIIHKTQKIEEETKEIAINNKPIPRYIG